MDAVEKLRNDFHNYKQGVDRILDEVQKINRLADLRLTESERKVASLENELERLREKLRIGQN